MNTSSPYPSQSPDIDPLCLSSFSLLTVLAKLIFSVILVLVGLVGTILNTFLLYLFLRWRFLRRGGNKLFFSVSIADFFVTSFFVITKILQMYVKNSCNVNKLGNYLMAFLTVSSTCVAVISFTYYRRLKRFRKFNFLSREDEPPYFWIIAGCWCTPLILIVPVYLPYIIHLTIAILLLLLYYAIFVICYNLVVKQLMEQYKTARKLDVARVDRMVVSIKFKRTAELIGLIMLSAFVLSLPLLLFLISILMLDVSGQKLRQSHTIILSAIGQFGYIIHATITPMICLIKHPDIKKAFNKTLKRFKRKARSKVTPYVAN